ncbi:Sodium-dependent phosphate transporter [Candidatus Syntrophocurvum alkaliphilum]|uniref:Sodium-dependent phosphate transporter n=1 Tax=Candidatus Syntrophocurvum alkaliphilum TaxID=2293317 RepID=A0A6I6DJG3_9FIRM|nr:Na/Pi cotransporter family protein [Candidatus Syntrophocurvum alkaliphilum]QGU00234.1 Sodium-dependent phosphate transporter [Candidatus Syntrophocurvum alkaliphilum]
MDISIRDVLFAFVGGLGLFLFGLRFMSEALQSVAGDRMRSILEQGTKSPIRGVITGAIVTALIQSSSATIVLTVGLVNAQLLTLRQAIGVIMGANIGTTLTAYLIGLDLKEYALPIISIGVLTFLFAKQKRAQLIGQAIFGFGLIFFGLTIMGDGMSPLKDWEIFTNLMMSIDNNSLIGVFIGMVFTFVVQSSSATIGVLQELAYQGAVTYQQAIPILFGDNIGTTITALLAAIGASVAARRAAVTHFLFNLTGTLIFLPLFALGIFEKMVVLFTNYFFAILPDSVGVWETLNIKLQIAQTHAVFNLSNMLIHLPLVTILALIVTKVIPGKEEEEAYEYKTKFIDKRFLNNPAVALAQATRETVRMGKLAREAFTNAIDYLKTRNKALVVKGMELEDIVDALERDITDYVVLASQKPLSREDSNYAYVILQSLNHIERIADLCENIINQSDYATKHNVEFSGEAKEELNTMIELTNETLNLTLIALERRDKAMARRVNQNEQIMDKMQIDYRKNHIRRLNEGICNGNNGAVFLDILGNLERITDHCKNITQYIMGEA